MKTNESRLFVHFGDVRELKEFSFLRKKSLVTKVTEEADRFVVYHKPLNGNLSAELEVYLLDPKWQMPDDLYERLHADDEDGNLGLTASNH